MLRLPEATRVVASNKSTELAKTGTEARDPRNRYFLVLLTMGVIDGATRMGFLTFLPFLLRGKDATTDRRLSACSRVHRWRHG